MPRHWPSHWMFAGDGWLQSSLYHCIWAGLPPAPGITPSHMTPSLHPILCIGVTFPEATLATDICTCPTCPPANAHNWLWWKGAWQNYPEITGQFRLHAALRQPHLFWVIIMRGMEWSFFEQIAKKKLIDNDDDLIQTSLKMITWSGMWCTVPCTVPCTVQYRGRGWYELREWGEVQGGGNGVFMCPIEP